MNNNFQNLNYQKISAAAVSIVAALLVPAVVGYVLYLDCEKGEKVWLKRDRNVFFSLESSPLFFSIR